MSTATLQPQVTQEQLNEYLNLVDVINSERDILVWNYVQSDNPDELISYLES